MVHVRKMQLWGGTIAVLAAFAVLGSVPAAAQAACGLPSVARMWKDGGCAGSYLSMFKNDSIPHFSTYGFNDNISSAEAGQCQSIRIWIDASYSGASQPIAAAGFITLLNGTFNNRTSSSQSYANASC